MFQFQSMMDLDCFYLVSSKTAALVPTNKVNDYSSTSSRVTVETDGFQSNQYDKTPPLLTWSIPGPPLGV